MKEYLEWGPLNWIMNNVVSQIIVSYSLFMAACVPAAIKPAATVSGIAVVAGMVLGSGERGFKAFFWFKKAFTKLKNCYSGCCLIGSNVLVLNSLKVF
jgi:hypothetical protein